MLFSFVQISLLNTLAALNVLSGEIIPNSGPVLASPTYRKSLAIGQFYKVCVVLSYEMKTICIDIMHNQIS